MIYHLFNSSPYTKRFIDFLAENPESFDLTKHYFIVNVESDAAYMKGVAVVPNYEEVKVKWGYKKTLKKMEQLDKLIIHDLSRPWLIYYLFLHPRILHQCIWSMWGGDVYYDYFKPNTFKANITEIIRRLIIPKIPMTTGILEGDYKTAQKIYNLKANYLFSFYPNPINFKLLKEVSYREIEKSTTVILLGNSGSPTNRHCEILNVLSKFGDEDIKVIVPLSYGDPSYIESVKLYGKNILGEKFFPLTEFLEAKDYLEVLQTADVVIMNHAFQEALGTQLALLALGKKVFVRSETTSYGYFQQMNIKVYDTTRLKELSLEEIVSFDSAIAKTNISILQAIFSQANAIKNWQRVFQ